MLRVVQRVCGMAVLALGLSLVSVSAHAQMRDFRGQVDEISAKKIIIDNRQGDKVSFDKLDSTTVDGEKTKWEDIKKKDWVNVNWKFTDKPRKAYKVTVLPAQKEAGEEVQ